MDKQMIEEMAKEVEKSYTAYRGFCPHKPTVCSTIRNCMYCNIATHLIEQGYRKIPENAVVLTEEELAQIQSNFFDAGIKHGSKETAEKFAEMVSKAFIGLSCIDIDEWNWCQRKIDEICKEITEGKDG